MVRGGVRKPRLCEALMSPEALKCKAGVKVRLPVLIPSSRNNLTEAGPHRIVGASRKGADAGFRLRLRSFAAAGVSPIIFESWYQSLSRTLRVRRVLSTNGANHASPGQRPGFGSRNDRALKGRDHLGPPFQGFVVLVADYPGRCPGLACLRAVGPQRMSPSTVNDRL